MVPFRPSLRRLCLAIVFALGIAALSSGHGAEARTLAQVCADYGVSQSKNTMLHGTERLAKGTGRLFFLARVDAGQAQAMDKLWEALGKTRFLEMRTGEPKEPYIFIVLNTGTHSKMSPVEEFWVDADGNLFFLADHNKRPREFMVFKGPEAAAWARQAIDTYGKTIQ